MPGHETYVASDHALWVVARHGWEQLASAGTKLDIVEPRHREQLAKFAAGSHRTCCVSADQFSCGPSGASFLQHDDFNIYAERDKSGGSEGFGLLALGIIVIYVCVKK